MTVPKVLTIAGSDSSGAAGVQADLKTFAAFDVYGLSVLTLVTAQNSVAMQAVEPMPLTLIEAQIDCVLSDIGADAVKTGMLLRAEVIELVAKKMAQYAVGKLVVDPVMVAGDGRRLISAEADRAYIEKLFPLALVVTPNLDEAGLLIGRRVSNHTEVMIAAQIIRDMGPPNVLIKGGHASEGDEIVDILYDGAEFHEFSAPRIASWNARGTGCTFASAIAAELAKGSDIHEAVRLAKDYVTAALGAAVGWKIGSGRGTVWHGVRWKPSP